MAKMSYDMRYDMRIPQAPEASYAGDLRSTDIDASQIYEGQIFHDSVRGDLLVAKRDMATGSLVLQSVKQERNEIYATRPSDTESFIFKVVTHIDTTKWKIGDITELAVQPTLYNGDKGIKYSFAVVYMGRSRIDGGLLFHMISINSEHKQKLFDAIQTSRLFINSIEYSVDVSLVSDSDYTTEDPINHSDDNEDDNILEKFL